MSEEDRVSTLETQQALFTDGLMRMLQNQWVGFPSLAADLDALSPDIDLDPRPPLPVSQAAPEQPDWLVYFNDHRNHPMDPQAYSWTCSVCALTWLLQATGIDPHASRYNIGLAIGYPGCIDEYTGLKNTECLINVLDNYGVPSSYEWLNFDQVYALAGATAAIMSGGAWYHWVGLRGTNGSDLWIANSALGYKGVWETLSRNQFNSLGPFKAVFLIA